MGQGGQANITIVDGGSASIVVPGSSTQLLIGCCSSGTANSLIVTRSTSTLVSNLGIGPLVEAASLACVAGGTVIAIKAPSNTVGAAGSVTHTGTGASVMTVTGNPVDTFYVIVKIITSGTVGTGPWSFQYSMDAGRNYGPTIAMTTATTYLINYVGNGQTVSTGITLNFTSATVVAGDTYQFGTTEPLWNTAGVQAALNAFQASTYAVVGVGSTHIVGSQGGGASGANCSTIEGYLDTLANGFVYTRSFFSARDASPPSAYSGTGEVEATWMSSIEADYASVAARRMCVGAAYYNMPTALPSPSTYGAPALRRPIAYAAGARQVVIPPQRHLGRVKDGSLSQVVVNAALDPLDGFIYHDERINPGLDYVIAQTGTNRFMSTMSRLGAPGVFITNPLTQAPLGSDFFLMPLGTVMDIFCDIVHQTAQLEIDSDVRLNQNGTIYENDARAIEALIASAVNAQMFATNMISTQVQTGPSASGAAIVVDRTTNVRATNTVNITGTILARGYVLTENITLSYLNPNAAA